MAPYQYIAIVALCIASHHSNAQIEETVVYGRKVNLIGQAVSSSQGLIGHEELALRPSSRIGDLLETIPGMVATQHSGNGKANQYFLRGFNLDHGTDFATFFDNMPVNMRSHGHGQGYTDLNFVIPELIKEIEFKKGPYYAEVGDFSSAGFTNLQSFDRVSTGVLHASTGADQYRRLVAMDSQESLGGSALYAGEFTQYDGPWVDIEENVSKTNLFLKQSWTTSSGNASVSLMHYDNAWTSADQIPQRAVKSGVVHELGSLDTTLGGKSNRQSLSLHWQSNYWQATTYYIASDLNLWSNFTYFLNDRQNGDQFEQVDRRDMVGFSISRSSESELAAFAQRNVVGIEMRRDSIDEVGLYQSKARKRIGAVRTDAIEELSTGIYWQNQIFWRENLRSSVGLRYDSFDFTVRTNIAQNHLGVDLGQNNGSAHAGMVTAKAGLTYTLSPAVEMYGSVGQGFHSNDARGVTAEVSPEDGSSVQPVDPLVRSTGGEVGLRGFWQDSVNASLSLWYLELDSELVFVGDVGITEASRASRRRGIEASVYYSFADAYTLDVEYALTDSQHKTIEQTGLVDGNHVPGALRSVVSVGLSWQPDSNWFGSIRLRHIGPRPLNEAGTVSSASSTIANLRLGYQWPRLSLSCDLLNLFDSDNHDIDYLYESQLSEESEPVEDIHFKVIEPRMFRAGVTYRF